jgi:hypothetical protein
MAAAMRGTIVYDTRGVVDLEAAQAAGLQVVRLGRPATQGPDRVAETAYTAPDATGSAIAEPAASRAKES